ncbi:UNKNOWN [Stylonychia lemnae]|uniref:Uncharacterized protein n=1 Tax=Stylonychia lemnae TaxID=5949 RepID=A0A078B7E4_STYLE|nr:UNKNOWN [Stylonychia lemnae]|eukprot:CDW89473.1 UNKNOWN [Stylonychia lemnae]
MDVKTVKAMVHNVPNLQNQLNLHKLSTYKGSKFRNYVIFLTCIPLVAMGDLNGGISKLGFTSHTPSEEFKVRPDYVTDTVLVAHRQDVPEFKYI